MPSRQDHMHSYQFMVQRLVAAIVLRDTDPVHPPFRRLVAAASAGVLLATLALAATAGYGLLVRDDDSWRAGDALIVAKESSARYVYRDGLLHPVLNYTSALLILGIGRPRTVYVPARSLAAVPRGTPLGIPGAPDALAEPERLVGLPWTLCGSALHLGGGGAGGRALGDLGLLVRDPAGTSYLIWRNRRHPIREPAVVLAALGWGRAPHVRVPTPVLDALPVGDDLARIPIEGRGRPSGLAGLRVGDVVVVESQGGARQYAVALAGGLAPVTQMQADLLLAERGTRLRRLDPGSYTTAPKLDDLVPGGPVPPPEETPELVRPAGELCVDVADGTVGVRVDVPVDGVDGVVVPPGRGAVVDAGGTLSVVTDLGMRYAVPSREVLAMLGYGDVTPLRLPAGVVALLPAGPALDPGVIHRFANRATG